MRKSIRRALASGLAIAATMALAATPSSAATWRGKRVYSGYDRTVVRVADDDVRTWRRHRAWVRRGELVAVRAPFTYVETRPYRHVAVEAPFASVYVDRGGTWVRAPFVDLYVPH